MVIHAPVEATQNNRASQASMFGSTTTSNLSYHGGTGGIGVETAPKIYLVLWGSQWSSDPSGEEAILEKFFNGIDSSGVENGDKCAWISSGSGASANFTFSSGTFPVQSLWNNATTSCEMAY